MVSPQMKIKPRGGLIQLPHPRRHASRLSLAPSMSPHTNSVTHDRVTRLRALAHARPTGKRVVRAPFPLRDVRESWVLPDSNGTAVDDAVVVETTVEYAMGLGRLGAALNSSIVSRLIQREMREGLRGLKRYAETISEGVPEVANDALVP